MAQTRQLDHVMDLLALHRVDPARYPFLLQSVAHGTGQARVDILFAFPGETLRLDELTADSDDFLEHLDARWRAAHVRQSAPAELPFSGGWFVYLAYELAQQVEPRLSLPTAEDGLPVAFAARIPAAVIVDHQRQRTTLVAETGEEHRLDLMAADLRRVVDVVTADAGPGFTLSEEPPQKYLSGVRRIKQYIVDGDVFQVNLSRRWDALAEHTAHSLDPADLYRQLCIHNPAPFAGLARIGDATIISSSPERLVSVKNGNVQTRPIAGTRPRSTEPEVDRALQQELLAHPKERAEHIMLIDLERNDLGRVCVPGSVQVDELMVLESYAHVHHIVSNVRGQLRESVSPGEVIRAVFPGGTITGCPKVRCMEIIAELEQQGRGAYTGSMGYLNHDGSMDLNILIRTLVQKGRRVQLRAGAGIVADSQPDKELAESRDKARGMLLALR
ncbi:MAG: aminodeoxychorismate synthase component I [Gammaproteobacteria bacterium]|nr:aminodeoxychorismate synthase component I [Gammaproteobacteria bacterium]